jgi:hypothetical protein
MCNVNYHSGADAGNRSWRSRYSSSQSQQNSAMLDISQSIRFDDDVKDGKSHELKVYTLDCIKSATCNFSDSNKLGAGGFGPVYLVCIYSINGNTHYVILGISAMNFINNCREN